ncbi:MAG TPA: ATP-binding protein [Oligoflexus sp.]|uniref:ATP-binding protein n=1 Tax=Oligoflexus sp. TaxID=1971216 RepID=UPI002D288AB3|nr:ATP-binding protein [Oligoflexus sp.]HYX37228.1 ATP-binding protein [Oligoflexus sp.]
MAETFDLDSILDRENEVVECKENVADWMDLVRCLVAFANDYSNRGGGYAIAGIKEIKNEHNFPAFQKVGLNATRLQEVKGKVLSACKNHVSPQLIPIVHEVPTEDPSKRILVFVVPSSSAAHCYRSEASESGTYYIRLDSSTIEARNEVLRRLLSKKGLIEPWDRRICEESSIEDLDIYSIRDFLQRIGIWNERSSIEKYLSCDVQISELCPALCGRSKIDGKTKPRNFSILLFGKHPTKYIPGCYVYFSQYPGSDRTEPNAERREITGNLVNQAATLLSLLNVEASIAYDKNDSNPNLVKYPIRALQEATINALVHRDYEKDQPNRLTVFTDRIEILSEGGLPESLDPSRFKSGQESAFWRNQALAYFFTRLQMAQSEGQGITTIIKTMKDEGCPDPVFDIDLNRVKCSLPAHPRHTLIRKLRLIGEKIEIGKLAEASEGVMDILSRDPYNSKAIDLFCEISELSRDASSLYKFLIDNKIDFDRLHVTVQVNLAGLFLADESSNVDVVDFGKKLLKSIASMRLQEGEFRKTLRILRNSREDDLALELIDNIFRDFPNLASNSSILSDRAKARMGIAKKLIDTARDGSMRHERRASAWERCREYLYLARKDLDLALTNATERERPYIEKDLEFCNYLSEISKKTTRKTHHNHDKNKNRPLKDDRNSSNKSNAQNGQKTANGPQKSFITNRGSDKK